MSRHIVTALPLLSIDLNQGGNAPGGGGRQCYGVNTHRDAVENEA